MSVGQRAPSAMVGRLWGCSPVSRPCYPADRRSPRLPPRCGGTVWRPATTLAKPTGWPGRGPRVARAKPGWRAPVGPPPRAVARSPDRATRSTGGLPARPGSAVSRSGDRPQRWQSPRGVSRWAGVPGHAALFPGNPSHRTHISTRVVARSPDRATRPTAGLPACPAVRWHGRETGHNAGKARMACPGGRSFRGALRICPGHPSTGTHIAITIGADSSPASGRSDCSGVERVFTMLERLNPRGPGPRWHQGC
jgi:hypothetical protein